jgi:undecaprenyl-diphosphatase
MNDLLHYLFLAILQGISEILPISSSGHLALYQAIFEVNQGSEATFSILLHAGSLLAFLVYFFPLLWRLFLSLLGFIQGQRSARIQDDMSLLYYWIIATLPAAIIGVFISDWIDQIFQNLVFVGIGFFLTSSLLMLVFILANNTKKSSYSLRSALGAGLAQMLGILPGISRSGSTISGALLTGLSLDKAKELSFLMFLPLSAGSLLLSMDTFVSVEPSTLLVMLLATGVSAIVTWLTLRFVLKHLQVKHFPYFSIYLIVIALLTLTIAWLP